MKMIGMVCVAALAANAKIPVCAMISETFRRTMSAASAGCRSG
jgi:hypothetical protein